MAAAKNRKVFVVHGRNLAARDAVFTFLRAIDLQPIEFEQAIAATGQGSPHIGDVLDRAFDDAQAIVVLMTPDEITYLRSEYSDGEHDRETQPAAQARPNVLFEAGMAHGRSPKQTILVEFGNLRPFSDVAGRHALRLRDDAASRQQLATRLQTAGCAVDTSGKDWLQAGDFTPPADPSDGVPLGKKLVSPRRPRVAFDIRYMGRSNGSGRLQVTNRGTEDVFQVAISLPKDGAARISVDDDDPVQRLPGGKSFMVPIHKTWGGGSDHFDVTVTGKLADGTSVSEDVFVSVVD